MTRFKRLTDAGVPQHPVLAALDEIGMGWLAGFAEQGFEDIAGVVWLAQEGAPHD